MENQINIDKNPEASPYMPKKKINLWMISTIILATILLFSRLPANNQKTKTNSISTISPQSQEKNEEISERYTVEYPTDFFITYKDYYSFSVAEKRWQGNEANFPIAGITTNTNIIPSGMDLRVWLNGVSDPTPPVGSGTPKSCKDFLEELRQQLEYGDLFNYTPLQGNNCIYLGISRIKDATVAGLPALEFQTEAVSSGATHTIFVSKDQSGSTILFDIHFSITGMSDEKDRTIEAYKLFLNTIKPREITSY